MKECPTYEAKIYIGSHEGYAYRDRDSAYHDAYDFCREYCDTTGLCVSFTETEFIYSGGNEPGFIIGLINYPRFPSTPEQILEHAYNIAVRLMVQLKQERCSIVATDKTVMIEREDLGKI